jgi:excisionase family DNA binding protein
MAQTTTTESYDSAEYVTTEEVAKRYRVCIQTVRRWAREGVLSPIKVGRRYLYRDSEVRAALERTGRL